jgi:hypothetical protein
MMMLRRLFMCAALVALAAGTAAAVDLKNEDSKRYEVRISQEGSGATLETSIDGSSTTASVCDECIIEVVGVGKISASGGETVVIRDGKHGDALPRPRAEDVFDGLAARPQRPPDAHRAPRGQPQSPRPRGLCHAGRQEQRADGREKHSASECRSHRHTFITSARS